MQSSNDTLLPEISASPRPAADAELREAMRLFPTGVALLSCGHGEEAVATTINAVMSVSLTPPRVLISLLRGSRGHTTLTATHSFTLNLLAGTHTATAQLFAQRAKPVGTALAAHLRPHPDAGHALDVLPGALATLGCEVETVYPGGDHDLFLGRVTHVLPGATEEPPLVFHHGQLKPAS